MSEMDEGIPVRSKFWTWFLPVVLLVLMTVPVFCIGIALHKTNCAGLASRSHPPSSLPEQAASSYPGSSQYPGRGQGDSLGALRERIEKIASSVIRPPQLSSKMERVQIQARASSSPPISKASETIHALLRDKKHQFVEAVSPDSIRIVVILPGNEWPALSGSLQVAAEKDGFIYRGPSQTSSPDTGVDSMIAEIEILRKGFSQSKSTKK